MAIKSNQKITEVPEYAAKLPSRGIPYLTPGREPFDTLIVRPYSWQSEKILLGNTPVYEKFQGVLDAVVKFPPGMNAERLIDGDYQYLLAIARALTYGEPYVFHATCPNCTHKETVTIRVPDDVPVKPPPEHVKTLDDLNDWLEVILPHTKDRVKWKYLSLANELSAIKQMGLVVDAYRKKKAAERKAAISQGITLPPDDGAEVVGASEEIQWASRIVSINGTIPESLEEARTWVSGLYGKDMVTFMEAVQEKSIGVRFEYGLKCDACEFEYRVSYPLDREFFRGGPSGGRDHAEQTVGGETQEHGEGDS
jgi:hypothetical protein